GNGPGRHSWPDGPGAACGPCPTPTSSGSSCTGRSRSGPGSTSTCPVPSTTSGGSRPATVTSPRCASPATRPCTPATSPPRPPRTDLTPNRRGYGQSVGRHGGQLARAAADRWDHFLGGHRPTVLDLLAWQAAGRADRVLVGHPDRTWTEVPAEVAAIRAAAAR